MRTAALLLTGVSVVACTQDDELDEFDRQRVVTFAPPADYDAELMFRRGDGRVRDAAAGGEGDGGASDEGASDATSDVQVEPSADAGSADAAAAPDADLNQCRSARECAFAVRLEACDPCPTATTQAEIDADPCVEPWVPEATIFDYGRPDCVAECTFEDRVCAFDPNGIDCRAGRCALLR